MDICVKPSSLASTLAGPLISGLCENACETLRSHARMAGVRMKVEFARWSFGGKVCSLRLPSSAKTVSREKPLADSIAQGKAPLRVCEDEYRVVSPHGIEVALGYSTLTFWAAKKIIAQCERALGKDIDKDAATIVARLQRSIAYSFSPELADRLLPGGPSPKCHSLSPEQRQRLQLPPFGPTEDADEGCLEPG